MPTGDVIPARPETEDLLYRCTFGAPDFRLAGWDGQFLNDLFQAAAVSGIARVEDITIDRKPDSLSQQSLNLRLLQGKGNFRLSVDRYEISVGNYAEDELTKLIDGIGRIHQTLAKRVATFSPSKSQVVLAFHMTLEGTTSEDYFRNQLKGQVKLVWRKDFRL